MSFPRYPEYRHGGDPWLGAVPTQWKIGALRRFVSRIEQGWSPECLSRAAEDGEWGVLKAGCVNGGRYVDTENKALPITLKPAPELEVAPGDLLMCRASGSRDLVGSAGLVRATRPFLMLSDKIFRLRPATGVGAPFMAYALGAISSRRQVEAATSGAEGLANNLPQSMLKSLLITVPPIEEQQVITYFLDQETGKIDALVAEQERLIELLKEKRQAVIGRAVTKGLDAGAPTKSTGLGWLGDVPANWEVTTFKRVVRSIEQGWSPQCEGSAADADDEWGVLKVGCVNGGTFDPTENKLLPTGMKPPTALGLVKGDLLVSRANTRQLVGSAAVIERDYPRLLLCDKLYRLRFPRDVVHPQFIALYLGGRAVRSQIEHQATGASASMVNISQSAIMELPVAIPPLAEQEFILRVLRGQVQRLDVLATSSVGAIRLLRERRSALISAAVTGQIDVRGLVPETHSARQ